MTIIASFLYAKIPIFFADILITTSGRARLFFESIPHPVQGNNFAELAGSFQHNATGLVQKLTIVSDELVVASAGSIYGTSLVIKKLIELADKPISVNILKNFFSKSNIESITTQNINLIAYFLKPPKKLIYVFLYGANLEGLSKFAQFKYIAYAGSGSSLFLEAITDIDSRIPVLCPIYVDNKVSLLNFDDLPAPLKSKYMTQHILMWMLLQDHTSDFRAFKEKCGAGYEMVWHVEGKFQKTDDYTIVYWVYFKKKILIKAIIKPLYHDDYLYIRYIGFDQNGVERDETFEVKPLEKYDFKTAKSNIKPEIKGRFLSNIIVKLLEDGTIQDVKPCVIINPDNLPLISMVNSELKVNPRLYSYIKQETLR